VGHSISGVSFSFRRAVVKLTPAGCGGLDVGVDRARYDLVSPPRLVLVDDRSALAVMTHPGHQIPETGAAGRSEVVPGVPEIVKVQAFGTYCPDFLGPSRHLVEVAAPQRPALEAGEDERFGLRAGKQRQVLVHGGDDR
jgi:hypothetical protein